MTQVSFFPFFCRSKIPTSKSDFRGTVRRSKKEFFISLLATLKDTSMAKNTSDITALSDDKICNLSGDDEPFPPLLMGVLPRVPMGMDSNYSNKLVARKVVISTLNRNGGDEHPTNSIGVPPPSPSGGNRSLLQQNANSEKGSNFHP